jgi:Rrf2 family protein
LRRVRARGRGDAAQAPHDLARARGPAAAEQAVDIAGSQQSEDRTLSQRTTYHGSGAVAFSTKGEYGVRLMVQLGRHYGSGPASLAEIAAEEELPRPYLEQLALGLREAGLVTSTRGARGGYELARPPEEIGMLEILRALEGPIAPMICVTDDPLEHVCGRTAKCTVNLLWLRIRDAVAGALETLTLADFLPPRPIAAELVGGRRGPGLGESRSADALAVGPTVRSGVAEASG